MEVYEKNAAPRWNRSVGLYLRVPPPEAVPGADSLSGAVVGVWLVAVELARPGRQLTRASTRFPELAKRVPEQIASLARFCARGIAKRLRDISALSRPEMSLSA